MENQYPEEQAEIIAAKLIEELEPLEDEIPVEVTTCSLAMAHDAIIAESDRGRPIIEEVDREELAGYGR
jgi:hypothetical protein